jgi:hypothetical protein
MFLEGGTRDHFTKWLEQEYPHLVEGYRTLYAKKYAPPAYRKEVSNVVGALRKQYGMSTREKADENRGGEETSSRAAETLMLDFRLKPEATTKPR